MDITMLRSHLGDELYTQVEERLGGLDGFRVIATNDGSWVPKTRIEEETAKARDLRTTVNSLTKELNDTKSKLEAAGTLQSQVDKLTADLADRDQQIVGMKRSGRIREALQKANIRDAALGEKVLDLTKITEDEKGNLTGLDEQIKALQESSPFLFNEPGGQKGGFGYDKNPASGAGAKDEHYDVNSAIRAAAGRHI